MNSFIRDFDTLLSAILDDYENQFPDADRSQGSLIFGKSAALASALWGLYKYQDYILKQATPGSADSDALSIWCSLYGIDRLTDEEDSALLSRLLTRLRQPPAGGNKTDWEAWALDKTYVHDSGLETEWTEGIKAARCYENPRGIGTVDLVVRAMDTETLVECALSADLRTVIEDYVNDHRPVTSIDWLLVSATALATDVTMVVADVTETVRGEIEDDITSMLNSMEIGKSLYLAQLISIAVGHGSENPTVSDPTGTVTPTNSQVIRAGTITVSAS